ncbi:MAG: hypothetical protein CMM01_04635 [Rhodopirellula sp.]|nr:hypothetical protein [Rhodopirellula sp.]
METIQGLSDSGAGRMGLFVRPQQHSERAENSLETHQTNSCPAPPATLVERYSRIVLQNSH